MFSIFGHCVAVLSRICVYNGRDFYLLSYYIITHTTMCGAPITAYINPQCASFVMAMVVSFVGLGIAIAGLAGLFATEKNSCFFVGLLTTILGLWSPQPTLKPTIRHNTHTSVAPDSPRREVP
jgi:hypothetical protein